MRTAWNFSLNKSGGKSWPRSVFGMERIWENAVKWEERGADFVRLLGARLLPFVEFTLPRFVKRERAIALSLSLSVSLFTSPPLFLLFHSWLKYRARCYQDEKTRPSKKEKERERRDSLARRTVNRMEATEFRSFLIKMYESSSRSLSEAYR